jgi:hypothetical protein
LLPCNNQLYPEARHRQAGASWRRAPYAHS